MHLQVNIDKVKRASEQIHRWEDVFAFWALAVIDTNNFYTFENINENHLEYVLLEGDFLVMIEKSDNFKSSMKIQNPSYTMIFIVSNIQSGE